MKKITTLLLLVIMMIPTISANASETGSEKQLSVLTQLGICKDMSMAPCGTISNLFYELEKKMYSVTTW